jgi:quinolinate synthase
VGRASPQADYVVFCGVHFMAESVTSSARRTKRRAAA